MLSSMMREMVEGGARMGGSIYDDIGVDLASGLTAGKNVWATPSGAIFTSPRAHGATQAFKIPDGKPAVWGKKGQNLERKSQFRPIQSGSDPAQMTGYAKATGAGALFGAMTADEDQRMRGAFAGAVGGGVAAKGMRSFSRGASSWSNSAFKSVNSKLGGDGWGPVGRGWQKHRGVVHKGLRGFHSSEGRNNMFRSGAMLGGAAFGAMFASNGKSHKRGFNQNRGNHFSR